MRYLMFAVGVALLIYGEHTPYENLSVVGVLLTFASCIAGLIVWLSKNQHL